MPPRNPASDTDIAFLLATSGHSGVDRVMGNLIPALARRGYRVDLLQVRRHGPKLDPVPAGVRLIDLGRDHVYPCLGAVTRYLRRERPRVLLADKDRVNRVALLAKALAGVPVRLLLRYGSTASVTLAGRGRASRWGHYLSMHYAYPYAYRVIVPSLGAADDLARFARLPRRLIQVVDNPLIGPALMDRARQPADHPWMGDGRVPVILGVGELCERKGFETLLRAFALVRARRPCRLLILGAGRRRGRLLQLADRLGIGQDVALPGFTPNPYAYMARARLFVLSSISEGLPTVLIEALALGTQVVSTDCPSGPREVLAAIAAATHAQGRRPSRGAGETASASPGPLVPVGDHQAMARAIDAALDYPVDAGILTAAARPYDIEAGTDSYLRAMRLAPTPTRPP